MSYAQSNSISPPDWELFKSKMTHFANLKNSDFEKYVSKEKDGLEKSFCISDNLGLNEEAKFLYGYNNAKQEYIECLISGFDQKKGVENIAEIKNKYSKIKSILEEVLDQDYQKYDPSSVRKECVFCSDSTMVLWKNVAESGTKFLEKKYVSLEYFENFGKIEITFFNDRRIIENFFEGKEKVEKPKGKFVINLKKEEFSNTISPLTKEGELVVDFLKLMKTEKPSSELLKSKMLPAFIISRQLASRDYFVNIFGTYGNYKVVEQNEDKVVVYLWAENLFWTHKITFKVKSENGKLFIHPSSANNDNYVIPWDSIERYVKVDFVK